MLFAAGLILLALGVVSGALLVLAPLGILNATAGLTLWILFPAFTIGGYLMAASPSQGATISLLSRVTGAILLLLALVSAVVLVLQAASLLETRTGTVSLWYVMLVGLTLGAAGVSKAASGKERSPGDAAEQK